MFGGDDVDLKIKDTLLQLREPLEYFQGMPVIDRIVKSLTTSQTFISGLTLPVKPGNYLGLEESKVDIKIQDAFKLTKGIFDLIIVDTAGRDALSGDLVDELKKIKEQLGRAPK